MKAELCSHCGHFQHHHSQGTGVCMQWLDTGFLCYCEEFKKPQELTPLTLTQEAGVE